MSDLLHLPKIPLGSPHGLKYYGFAPVIAHMPNFIDKMRVHSFGGLCRHVVNMSEAWRDVKMYTEGYVDLSYTFAYTSRCGGERNEFVLDRRPDGRSYTVLVNGTAVLTHDRYVEEEAFDALRTVMHHVRDKTRYLRRLQLDATNGPLIVYRDAIDEWLPTRMVCRVRRIELESVPWHRDVGDPWTMPKIPKLADVLVRGECDQRQLASLLDQLCTHDHQLHTVDVGWNRMWEPYVMENPNLYYWFDDWWSLPSQVADNDRLRRLVVTMVPLAWPSNAQFKRWTSLEALAPPNGKHAYTRVDVRAHTLADGLRLIADGFHHGRSLRVVACEMNAERPTMDTPTAGAKTAAIAWGDAHDWRTPVSYSELASLGFALPIYSEMRAWASAVVSIVEAIRSSSTPGRSITLTLCVQELPSYQRTAVKSLLRTVDYSTVSILDRPSVDVYIIDMNQANFILHHGVRLIHIVHGQLVDDEEN